MTGVALAGVLGLQGCVRMDEAALRAHLDQWFDLGETVGFATTQTCAAGVFRLVDPQIGSNLRITTSPGAALQALRARGAVALDMDGVSGDDSLTALINTDRTIGYQMRAVALEGRVCMDEVTESAFAHLFTSPEAVLAYDAELKALMLLDRQTRLLVVALGAGS